MSVVKQYACTVIVDASSNFNVSADSPNEAADQAQYLHSEQFGSLCHQCANEIDIGDVVGVIVYADDKEVLDTRYDARAMDTLRTANQRLEAQRDAILLQARCWAGEAKTQQSITKEVGEILGGIPSWGPIADSVAAIVADRQRLEGEVGDLSMLVRQLVQALRKAAPDHVLPDKALDYLKRKGLQGSPMRALSTANGKVTE